MRAEPEADFSRYVEARWADLVRGLEDEGIAPDDARLAVAAVLLARRRGWGRMVVEEHVDVHVWAALRERTALPPRPGAVPPRAPAEQVPELGDGPHEWFLRAHDVRRGRRLRALRAVLVSVTVVVLAGGGLAWWDARPEPPAVREEANALPVPWYAAGELHLADLVVALPTPDAFVARGDDVLVRERSGDLLLVGAGGDVHDLERPPAAFDDPPDEPPSPVPLGPYDVLLQSVRLPDGGWAHLLDSSRRPGAAEALRLSETGRRAVVVCDSDGACAEPQTAPSGTIRLR